MTGVTLYTGPTSQATPVANCTAPATQDPDGGCDLTLQSDSYDPAGLLAATTDAIGRTTNYTYDRDQHLIATSQTDPSTTADHGPPDQLHLRRRRQPDQPGSQRDQRRGGGHQHRHQLHRGRRRPVDQRADRPHSVGRRQRLRQPHHCLHLQRRQPGHRRGRSRRQRGSSTTGLRPTTSADQLTSRTVLDGGTNLHDHLDLQPERAAAVDDHPGRQRAPAPRAASYTTNYTYDQASNAGDRDRGRR